MKAGDLVDGTVRSLLFAADKNDPYAREMAKLPTHAGELPSHGRFSGTDVEADFVGLVVFAVYRLRPKPGRQPTAEFPDGVTDAVMEPAVEFDANGVGYARMVPMKDGKPPPFYTVTYEDGFSEKMVDGALKAHTYHVEGM